MKRKTPEIECWFLIPIVRDSDRRPHQPILWDLLHDALTWGWKGPEEVDWVKKVKRVSGGYPDPKRGRVVKDRSRQYTVLLPATDLPALRVILKKAGNSFDQQEVLLCVRGRRERIFPKPRDGFLW